MLLISFKTGNAAFEENEAHEITRILRNISEKIQSGNTSGKILDLNGNNIGFWNKTTIEEKGEPGTPMALTVKGHYTAGDTGHGSSDATESAIQSLLESSFEEMNLQATVTVKGVKPRRKNI
jgi:hypothetical protein